MLGQYSRFILVKCNEFMLGIIIYIYVILNILCQFQFNVICLYYCEKKYLCQLNVMYSC